MDRKIHIKISNMNYERKVNLIWKNFDFVESQLSELAISDGKYKIVTTNIEGTQIDSGMGIWQLTKLGRFIKIYLKKIESGETIVYKSFKTKTTKTSSPIKILKKAATISEVVKKFLISKCSDVQKIMNISNFTTDFEVEEVEKIFEEFECDVEDETVEVGDDKGGKGGKVCGGGKGDKPTKKRKHHEIDEDETEKIEETTFKILERFMGRNFPVKGNVQSGKTKFMISCAIWFILSGKSSLIILRNYTDDSDQLKIRIKQFADELYSTLEHSGFPRNLFPIEFADEDKITPESLNGTTPKILISIYNNTNLAKINKKIGENEKGKFVLFIDEADMLHKDADLTEITKGGDLTVASELQNLVNTCFCSFSVSGTILDAILKKTIKVEDLIVLQPPHGYKSHNNFLYSALTKKCKFTTLENEDIVQNDENILGFLDKFKDLPCYTFLNNQKHPRHCLMRVSKVKKPMNRFFEMICVNYRSLTCLLYTGDDIKLHHDSLENVNSIRLSNGKTSKNEKGVHIFKKGTSIGHILEWLKKNGGAEVFSNIITIAGDLASRGISFGSADFSTAKIPWHLTDMYATFAETTDIPEMIQITGRLCTVPKVDIPLTLYTTQSVRENLLKGFNITEEFVARAANVREKEQSVNDYVRGLNIFKNKVPDSDRPLTKFTKFTPKKVRTLEEDTKNGGWMTDEKGRYILRIVKNGEEETLANITKEGPVFGTIVEGADHPDPDDDDVIEIKKAKKPKFKNNIDEEEESYIISKPLSGVKLTTYNKVVEYLQGKNVWVKQAEIRKFSGINDTRDMNDLRGRDESKHTYGTKGLIWRKNGREYEYKYRV